MGTPPQTFCWTKIGAEAGEDVATIRLRKEWERRLGEGRFFWGVGQSLGDTPSYADTGHTGLRILFSPILGKAKSIDRAPQGILLWNAWIDSAGNAQPLPDYCFITSRSFLPSGKVKERHYALVCMSDRELGEETGCWISPCRLRNVATNSSLGASQVTAVVRVADSPSGDEGVRRYPISFVADLQPPYVLRLAQPTMLSASDIVQIRAVCAAGEMAGWRALVLRLRSRSTPLPAPSQQAFEFNTARDPVLERRRAR